MPQTLLPTRRAGVVLLACATALLAGAAGERASTEAIGMMSMPGIPGVPEAIAGDTRAIVAVPEPTTGGAPEGYVVTATPGGGTCMIPASAPLRVCTINALTNGVPHTFTATATNSSGTSAASPASNSITPGDMLAYDTALTLSGGDNIGNVMVMDPAGEFVLVGVRSTPGRITKVSIPDLTVEGVLTLDVGENDLWSGAIDATGHMAYFSTNNSQHIVQIDAATMTRVGGTSLEPGETRAHRLLFDAPRDVLYAVIASDPGKVVKFSTSLTRLSTVTLPAVAVTPQSALLSSDGTALYVGHRKPTPSPAHVSRVDLDNFTDAAVIFAAVDAGDVHLSALAEGFDGHLYLGTDTNPGRVVRATTSALVREHGIALPANHRNVLHAVVSPDRRQLYVTTNVPSILWTFDVDAPGSPGYAQVTSLVLPASATEVTSMAMDPFGHRIYIGTNTTPAQMVAVTVGPAPRRLPAAPPTVAATASATTVDITWQPPADTGGLTIQGYAVEQASSHSGPWTPASGGCALATTRVSTSVACTATGLTNQDYVFRVATRTTGGQGAWASISAAVTPTGTTTTTTTVVSRPPPPSPLVTQPVPTVPSATTMPVTTTTMPPGPATSATSLAPAPPAAITPAAVNGTSVTVNDGRLLLTVEPVACDGASCEVSTSVDGRPTITLSQRGRVRVSGDGFQPGTLAQVWLFSEPQFLGALPVAADGSFGGELEVPRVPPGEHTLQVHGLTPDGESRSAELGLRVLAAVEAADVVELPATGGRPSGTLAMSLLTAMVGILLWLHSRRFGRDEVGRQRRDLG